MLYQFWEGVGGKYHQMIGETAKDKDVRLRQKLFYLKCKSKHNLGSEKTKQY